MKKLLRKITAVLVAAGMMLPTAADLPGINLGMTVVASAAAQGTCGTNLIWSLDDTGTLTISGSGEMQDWENSSDVPWNNVKSSIISVVISEGVSSIGESAFQYCSSLERIYILDSVTSIGGYAFHTCTSLKSITIPDSVTKIEKYTFTNCTSLSEITIPKGVTSIDNINP